MSRKPTVTFEDFLKLEMKVARIVEVDDFPRARSPAYKVVLDLGLDSPRQRSSIQATNYTRAELLGKQVIAVTNFPPKNIAGFMSEALVLGVAGVDGRISLLTTSREGVLGSDVY